MAREQGPFLDVGSTFPAMEFSTVDGKRLSLPSGTMGKWTALLFYRGDW